MRKWTAHRSCLRSRMVPKCQSRGHDLVRDLGSDLVIGRSLDRSNFAAALRNRLRTHFTPLGPREATVTAFRKNPSLPSLLFSLNSYTATLGSFVLAVIPGCYRKEAAFSRYPRSVLVFSIPYQHWPSTHGTLHLVHRLALLFQVGRHHGCLGVPSSFKVTFYLREEPTALSPSLDHTITFIQSGSRKILTTPLSIVVAFQTYP